MIQLMILFVLLFQSLRFAPVPVGTKQNEKLPSIEFFDELNKHDYNAYMNEILKELHEDQNFLKEIEKNEGSDSVEQYIQNLNAASENARTKLDEIKRREIVRLNHLEKVLEKMHNKDNLSMDNDAILNSQSHISSKDNSRFTEEDLKALIARATHDINMVDQAEEIQYRRRRLRKRMVERKQIWQTKDLEERKKLREQFSENLRKRMKNMKVHEPGSQDQFKEVWQKQDHLDPNSFESKSFFKLHDLNQDDHWDIYEVEALVQPDAEKLSDAVNNADNIPEMYHQTMKMRQHIMDKIDANKDQLISMEEFLQFETTVDAKNDDAWKSSDELDSSLETDQSWEQYKDELSSLVNVNMDPLEIQKAESVPIKSLPVL